MLDVPASPILQHAGHPAEFRLAVRAWLESAAARHRALDPGQDQSSYEVQKWWMAERHMAGLGTPHWPIACGGVDLNLANQVIIAEEVVRARIPRLNIFSVSLFHLPATLLGWGSAEQKAKYLPGISLGAIWCQGFSEPNAGSDLASLRTRAERVPALGGIGGDHYIVNGHKIWSSYAMYADYCLLLVRTDLGKAKRKGISYLILDMKAPGVEVRPIRLSNGTEKFAEIFMTDVVVPVSERIGEENEGWKIAQSTLASERGVLSFEIGERLCHYLEGFYASAVAGRAAWLTDSQLRREFMRIFGRMQANRRLFRRLLVEGEAGSPAMAETVLYAKVHHSELKKEVGAFLLKTQGIDGHVCRPVSGDEFMDDPIVTYVDAFAGTIAGGSSEIMMNMIAERVLEMPR